ncbi:putative bZIP transcription factor [Aspergillus undulatus]|uniref:putative bZIP transcription factor n=1 Tax=Aspergillus undulatus TaxID=1810928 RepID=UPI003CCCC150
MGGINALPLSPHPAQPESHPAMGFGDALRQDIQWIGHRGCAVPQFIDDNIQFLSDISTNLPTPTADDTFSFPSNSTESSPHIPRLVVSNRQTTFSDGPGDFPDTNEHSLRHKTTMRRSQNRQAQRRFRERKEQQKTELLNRLDGLQSSHDRMADHLENMRRSNQILEADKGRLEREVQMLRKWRQKILGVMSDIIQQDGTTDELLTKVATSCSTACWRNGMDYTRTFVKMQTLLELFDEFQVSAGGRYTGESERKNSQHT